MRKKTKNSTRLRKRMISFAMIFFLLGTLVPFLQPEKSMQAEAAESESISKKDALSGLGFSVTEPNLGDEDVNPYTAAKDKATNLNPVNELYYGRWMGSEVYSQGYDYEKSDSSSGQGLNLGWYNGSLATSKTDMTENTLMLNSQQSKEYYSAQMTDAIAIRSCGLDTDGNGYQDIIVQSILNQNRSITTVLLSATDDTLLYTKTHANTSNLGTGYSWQGTALLSLAAGDFDGDGCDEFATYLSSQEQIEVYEVNSTISSSGKVESASLALKTS
ncbi:MAG: VCBS repeat-containing protein, partial [Lachnospiraceae bacterium]|nr:VCBS repeat-containing protein [Lachnospiraceae bacterium]